MAVKVIGASLVVDSAPYVAGIREAAAQTHALGVETAAVGREAKAGYEVATSGVVGYTAAVAESSAVERTAAERAEADIAKRVAANAVLQEEAAAYKAIALASTEGSAKQLAANRAVEVSNKKLAAAGLEVVAVDEAEVVATNQLTLALEKQALSGKGASGLFSSAVSSIKTAIAELPPAAKAVGVVGFAITAFALEGVKRFEKLAGEVRTFNRVAGTDAEGGSKLVYTLHQLGIEPEVAGKALGILSRNLVDHADKAQAAGVNIAHLKNGQIDLVGTLLNVGDAYKTAGAGAEGNAMAASLLGRGYQALLPILGKTREELQAIFADAQKRGLVFSAEDLESARQFTIAQREAKAAVQGLEIQLGKGLVPILTDVVTGLAGVVDEANELSRPFGGLGKIISTGLDLTPLNLFKDHVTGNSLALGGWLGKLENLTARAFPPLGLALDILGHKTEAHTKLTADQSVALATTRDQLALYGETLDDTEDSVDHLTDSHKQLDAEIKRHEKSLVDTAATIGVSVEGLAANIAFSGQVGVAAFAAEEEAAKKFAAAVTQGSATAAAAFAKSFDSAGAFSASALESAARSVTKSTDSVVKDDGRLADATQRVADLQEQYALKASEDRDAYAEKVAQANERMEESEQRYADTVETENDRVRDAEEQLAADRISLAEKVADAKRRLEEDQLQGQERIAAAQQRLDETEQRAAQEARDRAQADEDRRRLDAARTPQARKRIQDEIDARKAAEADARARAQSEKDIADAQADLDRARTEAAEKERQDRESIAKAELEQIKGIAAAEESVDKARTEQARNVAKAEQDVVAARAAANKLAAEGQSVGQLTLQQQVEMRKAVEAVTKAQEGLGSAMSSVGAEQTAAVKLTTEQVADFYRKSTEDADRFATGIKTAIKKGYDPQFIAKLIEQGPREAAPAIELILSQNDNNLRDIINSGEKGLREQALAMADISHNVEIASHSSSAQVRADFEIAMDALPILAENGGRLTAEKLAEKLGVGVADVRRIADEYGGALAAGINPVLKGVGAEPITTPTGETYVQGNGGRFLAATGGQVPGVGDTDSVPAMLTPGEFVLSKPAVERIGLENVQAMHEQARRGYAEGGFVSVDDVPPVPHYSAYGDKVGYAGTKVDRYAYDSVVDYLNEHSGSSSGHANGPVPTGEVADWVRAGVELAGKPASWVPPEVNIAMFESGGDPHAQNNWDCLTLDAQILTQRGWLAHDEVREGDLTIGYDPATGTSRWTRISRVVHYGAAPVVTVGNSRWSATTTMNHRWVNQPTITTPVVHPPKCPECGFVAQGSKAGHGVAVHRSKAHGIRRKPQRRMISPFVKFTTTADLRSRDRLILSAPADTPSLLDITEDEAAILGWVAGDGHVETIKHRPTWSIAQSKPNMVAKLQRLLVDVKHSEHVDKQRPGRQVRHVFRLNYEFVQDLAERSGWHGRPDSPTLVLALSPTQRSAWLQAMIDAEGTVSPQPGSKRKDRVTIAQCDGPVQDAIALAVYLSGSRPSFVRGPAHERWKPYGWIGVNSGFMGGAALQRVDAGVAPVWCVTTDLGSWTAQQHGHTFLTGNSNAEAGTPSKGIMQVIPPTFEAYKVKGHDDIWNPIDNVAAATNYIEARYGDPWNTPGEKSVARGGPYQGYEAGGLVVEARPWNTPGEKWVAAAAAAAPTALGRLLDHQLMGMDPAQGPEDRRRAVVNRGELLRQNAGELGQDRRRQARQLVEDRLARVLGAHGGQQGVADQRQLRADARAAGQSYDALATATPPTSGDQFIANAWPSVQGDDGSWAPWKADQPNGTSPERSDFLSDPQAPPAPRGLVHVGVMDHGGFLAPGANLVWNGLGRPEPVMPSAAAGAGGIDYDRLADVLIRALGDRQINFHYGDERDRQREGATTSRFLEAIYLAGARR